MLSRPSTELTFSFIISNNAITTQKFVKKVGTQIFGNAVFVRLKNKTIKVRPICMALQKMM